MTPTDRTKLADQYEAGLRKMEASGYAEFEQTIKDHKLIIAALRVPEAAPEIAKFGSAWTADAAPEAADAGAMAGERLWCLACGTVTRDNICDCNRWDDGNGMYREPNFVNYADALQKELRQIYEERAASPTAAGIAAPRFYPKLSTVRDEASRQYREAVDALNKTTDRDIADAEMRAPAASADAVRATLEALSMWCTSERRKVRGRGGFDDQSEREIGIGIVENELDRRVRALSAPVAGADASPAQADMREREIIERCAKVAEGYCPVGAFKHEGTKNGIAAAIRALPATGEADLLCGNCKEPATRS